MSQASGIGISNSCHVIVIIFRNFFTDTFISSVINRVNEIIYLSVDRLLFGIYNISDISHSIFAFPMLSKINVSQLYDKMSV